MFLTECLGESVSGQAMKRVSDVVWGDGLLGKVLLFKASGLQITSTHVKASLVMCLHPPQQGYGDRLVLGVYWLM